MASAPAATAARAQSQFPAGERSSVILKKWKVSSEQWKTWVKENLGEFQGGRNCWGITKLAELVVLSMESVI